jgi:hypothetical protein
MHTEQGLTLIELLLTTTLSCILLFMLLPVIGQRLVMYQNFTKMIMADYATLCDNKPDFSSQEKS